MSTWAPTLILCCSHGYLANINICGPTSADTAKRGQLNALSPTSFFFPYGPTDFIHFQQVFYFCTGLTRRENMTRNPPGYTSRDSFQRTLEIGRQAGVPSLGVITPTATASRKDGMHYVAVIDYKEALEKFVNVDGRMGKTVIDWPHDALRNKEAVAVYDKMSFADRFAQIDNDPSPLEKSVLQGFFSFACGGQWEDASFHEMLQWWVLSITITPRQLGSDIGCKTQSHSCIVQQFSYKSKNQQRHA